MKKLFFPLVALFLFTTPALADRVIVQKIFDNITPFTAAANASGYSDIIDLGYASGDFSLHYALSSVLGVCGVKFEYFASANKDATFYEPSGASDIVSAASASDVVGFAPVITRYMKIKYTGVGSNATDTTILGWLIWNVER